MARLKGNKIEGLRIDGDIWCFEEEILHLHMVNFFKKLFSLDYSNNGSFLSQGRFPLISLMTKRHFQWELVMRKFVR